MVRRIHSVRSTQYSHGGSVIKQLDLNLSQLPISNPSERWSNPSESLQITQPLQLSWLGSTRGDRPRAQKVLSCSPPTGAARPLCVSDLFFHVIHVWPIYSISDLKCRGELEVFAIHGWSGMTTPRWPSPPRQACSSLCLRCYSAPPTTLASPGLAS